jgi:hypothetical protein
MKVLLDSNVPEGVLSAFDRYETRHANHQGWQTLKNGELLQTACDEQFTVLVTVDKSIDNQQKAALYGLAILILRVFSNTLEGVLPLVDAAQEAIGQLKPGEVLYLYIEPRLREIDRRRKRGEFAQ